MKGYRDCVLWVNLSTGTIVKKNLNRSYVEKFIGGEGYGSAILWYEVPYTTHAFSPRNILSFNTGPLTGISAGSYSTSVVFLSPLSNWTGASSIDGQLGANLKYAGYDSLIIEGTSKNPVYLYIDNDIVELRDAAHIWGKNTKETINIIKDETKSDFTVACIGQAGERLSRLACILTDEGFFARAGSGSVMGSKKLKAIALRGTIDMNISCPRGLFENEISIPKPFDIKHEALFALKNGASVNSAEDSKTAAYYTEIYGIDPILTFATVSEAVKWYGQGIITINDTDGLELEAENNKAMLDIIKRMGLREGSGEIFADGLYYAGLKLGLDNISGLIENGIMDMALSTPEGGNYHITSDVLSTKALKCLLSELDIGNSKNQTGKWLKAIREYHMLLNLLGISGNSMMNTDITPTRLAKLYSETGIKTDKSELFKKSERVLAFQRALNYKKGFNKKNDYIPNIFLKTLLCFKSKEPSLSTDKVLMDLYEACDYDFQKAIPNPSRFLKLGLKDALDEL